jgi:hypothetical protein
MHVSVHEAWQDPLAVEIEDMAVEVGGGLLKHSSDAFPFDPEGTALDRLRFWGDETGFSKK